MEKKPTLSTVNRMMIRAVTVKDANSTLSQEEQEELLELTCMGSTIRLPRTNIAGATH